MSMISEIATSPVTVSSSNGQLGWCQLLDELKSKEGMTSDAELARSLNVTRGYICSIRKFRKNVSLELGQVIFSRLGRKVTERDLAIFAPLRIQRTTRTTSSPKGAKVRALQTYVFGRAAGKCELCTCEAPFLKPDGTPYLELHHLHSSSQGGQETKENLVALCPNCHRKMHICGTDSDLQTLIAATRLPGPCVKRFSAKPR